MTERERLNVQKLNLSNAMLTSIDYDLAQLQLNNVSRARLRTHMVTETNVLMAGLAKVKVPLNGIWGSADVRSTESRIEHLLRSIEPNAQFEVIEGAGHWVMLDAPRVPKWAFKGFGTKGMIKSEQAFLYPDAIVSSQWLVNHATIISIFLNVLCI